MTLQIAKQALLPRLARTYTPRVLLVSRYTCCACTVTPLPNRVRTSNPRAVISPKRPSYPPPSRRLRSRQFSTTNNPPLLKISSKNLPPRPKPPPEHEIEESFLKGSGPGGQKIVGVPSPLQLWLSRSPTYSTLPSRHFYDLIYICQHPLTRKTFLF